MRIDLAHDRVDHQPAYYRDPAVERIGVFAHLDEHELSAAEQDRAARATTRVAEAATAAPKEWTSQSILRRVTKLYARFIKPKSAD